MTSSTASVICVVGHKEDSVVKKASEFISAALNTRVVVTAGIHWDNIDDDGIREIIKRITSISEYIAQNFGNRDRGRP
jgi:hypothetical protein